MPAAAASSVQTPACSPEPPFLRLRLRPKSYLFLPALCFLLWASKGLKLRQIGVQFMAGALTKKTPIDVACVPWLGTVVFLPWGC